MVDCETKLHFSEPLDIATTFNLFVFLEFLVRDHLYPCCQIPLRGSMITMTYYVRLHYVAKENK